MIDGVYNFRFDAIKFCHKVFAIDRAWRSERKQTYKPWLVWIDADTVATAPIPEGFFEKIIYGNGAVATLMRDDQAYAETSFMAFDLGHIQTDFIFESVMEMYRDDQLLFEQSEWHDGWIYSQLFRHMRESFSKHIIRDLAPNSKGLDAFHQSPLVAFLQHFKGNKKHTPKAPFKVNPTHVVPNEEVIENIKTNSALVSNRLGQYVAHERRIWLVAGGPSIHSMRDAIEFAVAQGDTIMCVKHSLPILRSWGIEPHYCVVLDPRTVEGESTHGAKRKDLYGGRAGDTIYLVASMTSPDTLKHLMSLNAKIVLWHAFTKGCFDAKVVPANEIFITGGTCAIMRGVGIAYMMGFRRMEVVGVDASQLAEPSEKERAQLLQGRPKWFKVSTSPDDSGIQWWTTGELVALAQDVDALAKRGDLDANITWHGKSLAQEMWDAVGRGELPEYGA
jgi:hypothetical protein